MGGRQVVRHGSLEPAFVGSSPTRPALQEMFDFLGLANPILFPPLINLSFLVLAPSSQKRMQTLFGDRNPIVFCGKIGTVRLF